MDQRQAPLFEALQRYVNNGVIPFHVPGHKRGMGINNEFLEYIGRRTFEIDVNGMEDLDNICNPISVIKQSQMLTAQLFEADDAFFLVNGTTQGIQTMILYACKPGEKIIIPRNAHKSAISAFILSGAEPIYIQPEINLELGIAMGVSTSSIKHAIEKYPHAKAVFIIHPTYYGAISDIKEIGTLAHKNNMLVLADEAHGCHLKFDNSLPQSAMEAGADISAVSLHKTGGSMTQSSILLSKGKLVDPLGIKTSINLTQTTSASYVLMASLDLARKQLALKGENMIKQVAELARYARRKINQIDGLYAFGCELISTPGVWAFDETKLGINVRGLGLSGYEMETKLRKEYNIQVEMSDFYNILAIISIGDRVEQVDMLIYALESIARKQGKHSIIGSAIIPPAPKSCCSPRTAYYSPKISVPLEDAIGKISGEMLMAYPPGIPTICPGEEITLDVAEYIKMLKASRYQLQGTKDPFVDHIEVLNF